MDPQAPKGATRDTALDLSALIGEPVGESETIW
jgi:hypothetical protein